MKKQQKQKNVIDWLRKLPSPYKEMAMKYGNMRTFYEKDVSFSGALRGIMVWHQTEEGHDFWLGIEDNFNYRESKKSKLVNESEPVIGPDGLTENGEVVVL
jgi:hypothetical protein